MRPTAIRRTAVAATVMSLALLTAACGSDVADKEGGDKGKAAGTSSAQPSAAKVLSAAELEDVALVQGEVKGHKVAKAGPEDSVSADDITADKAACDVFADALMGAATGTPAASTKRKVTSEPKKGVDDNSADADEAFEAAFDITTTLTTLSSYEGKGAEESVAGLRTAASGCASGFTLTAAGSKQKIVKITEAKVEGGEEAAGWTVNTESDGDRMTMKLVQVRQGSTVASFTALNLAAAASGKDFELPTAVIDAQVAKLA
ncbi:hypothetical protein EDD93_1678 [Streptomyces sp. 840.1]|uniref:hypothetical protein n=1 Tax=Streptomyces sp. 840.1 TaxID=2485152 RepID=UPI000F9746A9|nr:hypothetical protein [Streptomyces sp. 840.1]ROQ67257.1 hypothetical protein EDD93_1678 [Streptomyces sp. 840.1]